MSVDTEIALLKRQNRRLKVALLAVTTVLLFAFGMAGVAGIHASRQAEQARAEAERALQMAKLVHAQTESRSESVP